MADRERQQRIEEIFLEAVELDADERAAFLDRACAGDHDLRREVESLLEHKDLAQESFLEKPVFAPPTEDISTDETEQLSRPATPRYESIGPYKLLQPLGAGGMGEVWLAEQREPLQRQVALKIIKRGMDTEEIIARFEAERQALALMDHPYVAKVYDAGSTPDGRPYFVMEHVAGTPITEHCDNHRLTMEERLRLFARVCEGVQHAHHKAIIHRDLKPSNILVTEHEGERVPKIIDFGVAKATAQKLTKKTLFTQHGALIGTPEYMSPEQADPSAEDVDTRTDVYSLGVVLYELLVGAPPFDPRALRSAGYEGIRRKIRSEEPPRPSTRLSSLGDRSTHCADNRRLDRGSLRRHLRGDLDWIAMKALEKDPARRYGSPAELAADLRRHLAHDPVLAGPPSASYRAGKLIRKHRGAFTAAAILLVGLIVGIAGIAAGLLRAVAAEKQAQAEAFRANQEAETSARVAEFLVTLFEVPDPSEAKGDSVTAREILDRGASEIRTELTEQPLIRARLLHTMGTVYEGLGLYPESEELLEEALRERQSRLPADDQDVVESILQIAITKGQAGELQPALDLLNDAIAMEDEARGSETLLGLALRHERATVATRLGELDLARRDFESLLEILDRDHPDERRRLATTLNNYGTMLKNAGELEDSADAFQRGYEILLDLGEENDPNVAQAMINVSAIRFMNDQLDEAIEILERALPLLDRVFGPDHRETVGARMNLAAFRFTKGDMDAARVSYYEGLERAESAFGPNHPQIAVFLTNIGRFHMVAEEPAAAKEVLVRARRILHDALGRPHSATAKAVYQLALAQEALGEVDDARASFEELIEIDEALLEPNDPQMIESLGEFAAFLERSGDAAGASRVRDRLDGIRAGEQSDKAPASDQ